MKSSAAVVQHATVAATAFDFSLAVLTRSNGMFRTLLHAKAIFEETTKNLAGKTLSVSGGSRGIGLAVTLRTACDGANIVIAAKTANPDPRLEGTIQTAAAVEAAGGKALAPVVDIRDEERVPGAVARAVEVFGGIDVKLEPRREAPARRR